MMGVARAQAMPGLETSKAVAAISPDSAKRAAQSPTFAEGRALRTVLVLALDRSAVASQIALDPALRRLPAGLYTLAAAAAGRDPAIWSRYAALLDDVLAPERCGFDAMSDVEVERTLTEADTCGALHAAEVAAALWSVLRRRDPRRLGFILRLAAAAEALCTAHAPPRSRGKVARSAAASDRRPADRGSVEYFCSAERAPRRRRPAERAPRRRRPAERAPRRHRPAERAEERKSTDC